MASPQCEHGYTRIADELLEAILRADLSKRELLVVLAVIRRTYGYRKTADRLSSAQIAAMTGLADSHCRATVRALKAKQVLQERDGLLGIQKDYECWGTPGPGGPKQSGPKQSGPMRTGPNQSAEPDQNGPPAGPKRSAKADQNGPHNRQTENLQTTTDSAAGRRRRPLQFPRGLSAAQRTEAERLVAPLNGAAQDALDEIAGMMAAGAIKTDPLACLRGIVRHIQAGDFGLNHGAKIRAARERADSAPPPTPASAAPNTEAILRRHAQLLGVPEDDYLSRFHAGAADAPSHVARKHSR
jgi:phage replication O-like protein O